MGAKDRIVEMLVQGIPGSAIAAAIGVSESYVSQLSSDEDVAAQVLEAQERLAAQDNEYDTKLDKVEDQFLDRIDEKSRFANLQQSLQAFKILNSARRRKESRAIQNQQQSAVVVPIILPVQVVPNFVMNSSSEIVEVQGRTMIAATVKNIDEVLQKKTPQQPKESHEIRGAQALQQLSNRPFRQAIKHASGEELSDLL